jgi:protein gp37
MVRFLSIEPLLEDIGALGLRGISWVIVGGESGPHARPFDLAWARDIIDQCRAASVPVFVKQIGSRPCGKWGIASEHLRPDDPWWTGKSRKGGDPSEWPADLRVREFP